MTEHQQEENLSVQHDVDDEVHDDVEGGNHSARKEVVTTTVVVDLTQEELQRNRTFMTMIHFILTYPRWSFSLFLLLASGSLPGALPSFEEAVQKPIQHLRAIVRLESEAYHECTVHAFDAAHVLLHEAAAEEWQRSLAVRESNLRLLHSNMTTVVNDCTAATEQAHEALAQWYQQQRSDPVPWTRPDNKTTESDGNVCTARDRDILVGGLAENRQAEMRSLSRRVEDRLATWHSRAIDTASSLSGYADSRAAYDYDYFVGQKVQAVLRRLIEFELDAATVTLPLFPEQELLTKIRSVLLGLMEILQDAKGRVGILNGRLLDFDASIRGFRSNYQDLFDRLSKASGFVKDFLPPRVKLPSYLDLTNVPIVELLMPPVFELPKFDADLADVNLDRILDSILKQVRGVILGSFHQVSEELQGMLDQLLDSIQEALSLDDYDPPQFRDIGSAVSMGEQVQELEEDGDKIQQQVSQILHDLVEDVPLEQPELGGENASSIPDVPTFEFPNIDGREPTSFAYLEPVFPSFVIPELILVLFSFALAHQWIIEAVIQFFRIARLKRKYERDATPDLPEIDLASDEDEKFSESSWTLVQTALLQHLLTPWMILGLVLFPFAFLSVTLWFPHVKNNCVDTRNGTFIARNMVFPILVNEASLVGNAYHAQAEFSCQRTQRESCTSRFQESEEMFRSDVLAKQALISQYNQSSERQDRFRRCLELDVLDDFFSKACCGLAGYTDGCLANEARRSSCPINLKTIPPSPFSQLGHILNDQERCSADAPTQWELLDSRFDCSALRDSCAVTTCPGINVDRVEWATIEIDCQVETYIVRCCVLILLALYHGVLVNLISSLAFNGVKHLRWRNLRPDGIKFRTSIAEDGTLVKGDSQDERSQRIQSALRRFELTGEVQIVLSSVLFTLWLVTFFLLRHWLQRLLTNRS